MKILYVQRNMQVALVVLQALHGMGHHATPASSIKGAVAELVNKQFDLILLEATLEVTHDAADFAIELKELGYAVAIFSSDKLAQREGIEFIYLEPGVNVETTLGQHHLFRKN